MILELMEEETLSSFAIRTLLVTGNLELKRAVSRLFKQDMTFLLFPSPPSAVAKIYSEPVKKYGQEYLLQNHTLIPLVRPITVPGFGLTHKYSSILECTYDGLKDRSNMLGLHKNEFNCQPVKYCPLCFKNQITQFGFTWFKREWLIPYIGGCIVHDCKLRLALCSCERGRSSLTPILNALTGQCSYCKNMLWTINKDDTDNRLANWLFQLLKSNLPTFSRELITHLLKESEIRLRLGLNRQAYNYSLHEPYFLAHIIDPCNIWRQSNISQKLSRARIHNRDLVERSLYDYLYPDHDRYQSIPLTYLFRPLSIAFPNIHDFLDYLHEISYVTKRIHGFPWKLSDEMIETLDLKDFATEATP